MGLFAATALAALPLAAVSPAGGGPDRTFGVDGTVVTAVGERDSWASSVAVQPDGKIVAAGGAGDDFALVRFRRDGNLDTGFGSGGKVTTDFGGVEFANAVAVQPDGRILAAGDADGDFALARYQPDGSLDATFGGDGRLVTDLGKRDAAWRVLLVPEGRIVVAGVSSGSFALVRYGPDGSLDPSFGNGGHVVSDFGVASRVGAAAAPGGKVVVSGFASVRREDLQFELVVARYAADGTRDGSFGIDGIVVTRPPPHWLGGDAVAVQPDGKIVIAAHGHTRRGEWGFALLRYKVDGSLDAAFGEGGWVVSPVGPGATALAIGRGGRIIAAGGSSDPGNFTVARYTPSGRLDRRFGRRGSLTTDFGGSDLPWGLVVQADGRILVAGRSGPPERGSFALARYVPPSCVVPKLRGRTLRGASAALVAAGCTLGRVRGSPREGRVVRQQPPPGRRLPEDDRVSLELRP